MPDSEKISLKYGDVEMRGFALGAGPPVVLVHGFAQSRRTWAANTEALASRYRVIAVDLPGFGASTKVALNRLEDFGDFLARLLASQGLESAHFVGHSFGGLVVLGFALNHPKRVRSLTVLGPSGMGPANSNFVISLAQARTWEDVKGTIAMAFHDPARFSNLIDKVVEVQLAYRAQPGVMGLLEILVDRAGAWISAVQSRLGELTVPMLVLWGEKDQVNFATGAERVRGLPNVKVHLFEGAGHAAQAEAAEAFNAKLLNFLDAQSAQ